MRPKRILYFHPSNELYGADRSLLRLVTSLDGDRYRAIVALPNDIAYEGLLTQELRAAGIPYDESKLGVLRRRYFRASGGALLLQRILTSSLRMARFARQNDVALIHSNSTAVVTGSFVARLAGLPHLLHAREIIASPAWLNKVIATNLALTADRVVAVSGPTKANLSAALPQLATKITVVHNGIDPAPFTQVPAAAREAQRKAWGIGDDEFAIGMVGRISAWKGQDFLLRAASPLLRERPRTRLVLVGGCVPGETDRKEALVRDVEELGLKRQVRIEEFSLDIPTVLSAFDLYVLPSIQPDPFPTVVLEAMAAGKPVVATYHGGAIEQVENGVTGLLVSPVDPREMTQALQLLYDDEAGRLAMGAAGRARLLRHFTVERYVRDIEQLYDEMLHVKH